MTVEATAVALVAIHLFHRWLQGFQLSSRKAQLKNKTKIQSDEHVLKHISRLTARSQVLLLIKICALFHTETLSDVSGAAVRG